MHNAYLSACVALWWEVVLLMYTEPSLFLKEGKEEGERDALVSDHVMKQLILFGFEQSLI